MPDLELTIFNQKLKLSYQANEKQRLINAVEILNKQWNKFSGLHGKVSDLKIITLIAVELQDSITDLRAINEKIHHQDNLVSSLQEKVKTNNKELEENSKIIHKYELELDNKNEEISKVEKIIDEIQYELLQIKNNILTNHDE